MIFDHQVLKSAKDLILRLRTEDESSKSLAAAMEEVNYYHRYLGQDIHLF